MDRDILDKQFYLRLVDEYRNKVLEQKITEDYLDKLPVSCQPLIKEVQDSKEFHRLLEVVSQWYALMEMCEDLIERTQIYGINQYIDHESSIKKLERNWQIRSVPADNIKAKMNQANGFFIRVMTSVL